MKYRQRKRRLHPDTVTLIRQIAFGLVFFGLLALLVTGIWHGTRVESLNINTVTVSGGETISHEKVQAKAEEQLRGTYFKLIPRTFAYLYPHDDIVAAIAGIERIRTITVTKVSGTELSITFDEYISVALWCKKNTEECVFVDSTGYAFAPAPQLTGGSFVRFFTTGKDPEVGQFIGSSEDYTWLTKLHALLAADKWTVSKIEIDSAKDAYFEIVDGGEFKVSLEMTPEEIVDNLRTVLSNEDFQSMTPGNFQYIDLRFGNKVFVNRTEPVATSSEEAVEEDSILEPQAPDTIEDVSTEPGADEEESASSTVEEL